jgi:hypothetical protein
VARRRAQWTKYRKRIDPSRLVFIDETWTKTNMAPLWGWAPRGQRLKAKVPHGQAQMLCNFWARSCVLSPGFALCRNIIWTDVFY